MQIRPYSELSVLERQDVRQFFEEYKGPTLSKNEKDVHAYMSMPDLEFGALFLSVWEEDQVIATLGVVLAALPERGEAYLTGAALRDTDVSVTGMEMLVKWCEGLVRQAVERHAESIHPPIKIKMGVGPRIAWLRPLAASWGFVLKEHMHHLVFQVGSQPMPARDHALQMVPLSHENKKMYVDIHNRSFKNVPNGGMVTIETVEKQIEELAQHIWMGLFIDSKSKIAVGFYELTLKGDGNETGWIESIGIDDAFQGQGMGKKALGTGMHFLSQNGAKQIELLVMDSNTRAEGLYLAEGFQLKQVFNQWYEKNLEITRK